MIFDDLKNADLYKGLGERINTALEFIKRKDLATMELGKHEIKGDEIFALVMEYETKPRSECIMEGHRKYIDVQYMVSGSELFEFAKHNNQTPVVPYDEEKEAWFLDDKGSLIEFKEDTFAIFYPTDLHRCAIQSPVPGKLRKVVVKVLAT